MKKYSEYKEVEGEWFFKIPSNWDCLKIRYLDNSEDTMFLDGDWIESKVIEEDGIRYLTTGNIGPGYYKEQGGGFISEKTFSDLNCTEVFPGDLVASRLNKPIGRACIIPDLGYRIIVAVDNVIIRPKQPFNNKYLMYVMNDVGYSSYTDLISRGATMQRVSRGQLGRIKIPFPSGPEQTQIAKYLDHKTAIIDALIEKKELLIKKLNQQRQSIINEAVTKGLPAEERAKAGLNPNAPMKDSGIEWLGEIPEHWEVVKIFHLCENIGSGTTPKSDKREYYDGEIGWLNTGDLNDSYVDNASKTITTIALEEYSVLKLHPAFSVVIALYGATIGKLAIIKDEMTTNQACCVLNPTKDLHYKFLFYSLMASRSYLLSLSYGGGQPNISQEIIRQLKIGFPKIGEQKQIILYLDNKLEAIEATLSKSFDSLKKLKSYRQSIISEAVTGKIDVREWQAQTTEKA